MKVGSPHPARWARFHTGFWHAYPPVDAGGRYIRSVCGFATSRVDDLQPLPGAAERWQCRQCRLVMGVVLDEGSETLPPTDTT
jgi:hypothetical protein